jgi:Ca-activated chloride channel homolog
VDPVPHREDAVSLLRPELLWFLLIVPALFVWPRTSVADKWHAAIRAVVVGMVVLAMALPVRLTADTTAHHVFVLDLSDSAADGAREVAKSALRTALAELDPEAHAYLVGLGRDLPWHARLLSVDSLAPNRSDLGAALLVAATRIPEGSSGAVTLLSDGLATNRNWSRATQTLTERGIPLHTIALDRPPTDVRPVSLTADGTLRVGQTARLFVDIASGGAERKADIEVTIEGPDGPVARSRELRLAGRQRVVLEFEPKRAGFVNYRASVRVVRGTDTRPANNSIENLFAVQDPVRVLYLGGRVSQSDARLAELVGPGFQLDTTAGDGRNGLDAYDLDQIDIVVLDDRKAADVPREFQRRLVTAVTDAGLGLCMTGGGASFGPGGYHKTPIESVLPVELVQKEEKKDPSTALAIIIDTSGSMGGNRIILAKEVTRLALRRLLPHDKIGIVEFFGNKRWAAPLQSAANAIDIQRALNRLDAGGGTILFPAIEEAYFGLRNVQTRYKHVLVLTDAGVESGPYEQLLRRMARDGICVSTVLVGPGRHSEFLVELADWGRGRFYNASDRFNLPEIMLKQPSSARLPGYRNGTQMVDAQGGRGWWGDIDPRATPPVQGYVETRPRPGADILLRTKQDRHPILASWRFGLGRVTAMTTEPTGPGTRGWEDWTDYGPFLARVLSRTASGGNLSFRFELVRRDATLVLTATRLDRGDARPTARISGIAGIEGDASAPEATRERAFEFRERAPGVFRARLDWPPDTAAHVLAGTEGRARGRFRLASRPEEDRADELQVDPDGALDLSDAAMSTGGTTIPPGRVSGVVLATGGGDRPLSLQRLWPFCLLLALVFYLADLLWRRRPRRSGVST